MKDDVISIPKIDPTIFNKYYYVFSDNYNKYVSSWFLLGDPKLKALRNVERVIEEDGLSLSDSTHIQIRIDALHRAILDDKPLLRGLIISHGKRLFPAHFLILAAASTDLSKPISRIPPVYDFDIPILVSTVTHLENEFLDDKKSGKEK